MRVLGLVPARAGSRGVSGKNIRPLLGRPLLAYTAEAALASGRLARVVLSTESEEIAQVGRELGLDVPFLRPPDLAEDDSPMLPVVQHALEGVGEPFDAVCLLQPTNPLRTTVTIDRCIEHLQTSGADSVVTMLPVPTEYNPHWVYERHANGGVRLSTGEDAPVARRQDLPPAFYRDGSVYVARTEVVLAGSLYGSRLEAIVSDPTESVNIDEMDDWAEAEAALKARLD